MNSPRLAAVRLTVVLALLGLPCPAPAALPDEVQVYDDSINKPGEFGLELHVNATPSGRGTPDYPGEFTPVHGLRTTLEPSYAVNGQVELGMYLPFDHLADGNQRFAGPRFRIKVIGAQATAASPWFYGVNFELSHVRPEFEDAEDFLETRPIFGWRKDGWMVAFNPVVGQPLRPGKRSGGPDFSPALKVSRAIGEGLAAGFEYYAELSQISHFLPYSQQSHTLFAAIDVDSGPLPFNLAIGRGLTAAADRWTVKAIFELPI
jgi:hypothetical protein